MSVDARTDDRRTLTQQVSQLFLRTGVYFVADASARAVSLLLIVAFTQVLGPADYAVLAVTSSITLFLGPVLGLSLTAGMSRLHFEAFDEDERRDLYGSALVFLLTVPIVVVGAIEITGQLGLLDFFNAVPYSPYLRLAVITALLTQYLDLPLSLYVVQGRARRVAVLSIGNALLLLGVSLFLVVVLDRGVLGVLTAAAVSAGVMAVAGLVLTWRLVRPRFNLSRRLIGACLAFSVPLIPHAFAQWLLQVSDRLILSHYVPSVRLGVYYVGYSVGSVAAFVVFAAGKAMAPIMTPELQAATRLVRVPRLGTYWLGGVTAGCLAVALFGGDAIKILAPNDFIDAAGIVPIVAFANVMFAIYTIVSSGTWFSMRTRWVPLLTGAAALVNVGLNVLLIPRYGIVAAAWNTVLGFAVLAIMQGVLAARSFHIRWEYARWAKLVAVAVAAFLTVELIAPDLSVLRFLLGVAAIAAMPIALTAVGFWTGDERRWLAARLRGRP